jgi:hypothetical protein
VSPDFQSTWPIGVFHINLAMDIRQTNPGRGDFTYGDFSSVSIQGQSCETPPVIATDRIARILVFFEITMQSTIYETQTTPLNSTDRSPYSDFVEGPLAPFGVPVWKPFLNILGTLFM